MRRCSEVVVVVVFLLKGEITKIVKIVKMIKIIKIIKITNEI